LALVEPVLEHDVGLELLGLGLVDLPPEESVALAAGDVAGLGEVVGAGWLGHGWVSTMSFEHRPLNIAPYGGFGRFAMDTLPRSYCSVFVEVDVTNPRLILISAEEM
jgi:hypothetical protein